MTDFTSLDDFVATPRIGQLCLSLDGRRLFTTVSTLSEDGTRWASAIWELDPAGTAPARRLTRSVDGESRLVAAPGGDLLFVSKRPAGTRTDDDVPALWSLPPAGEPQRIARRPGGIAAVAVAREAGTVVVAAPTLPSATDLDSDEAARKARKDAGVHAVLHETSPIRYWDHDIGPEQQRLFVATGAGNGGEDIVLRDLTPSPGRALEDYDNFTMSITPDGSTVISDWIVTDRPGYVVKTVVAIDVATGEQRTVISEPTVNFEGATLSPDGRWIACSRADEGSYDEPASSTLWLAPIDGGQGRDLLPDHELWPASLAWAPDSSAVYFTADENGRAPVFRVDLESGTLVRLASDGHFTNLAVDPSGQAVFAVRDRIDCPPRPVRLDPDGVDQEPIELDAPGATAVPGRVEDVHVDVDGARIRGWLVLPESASGESPAPLVLWIHGGPLSSWNSWSWRWNPWLMAARGYAVLMPDPALSTGYGAEMIRRGWGQWGGAPYDDIMAMTDAVVARPDIDETRTAAMGGSYGGYMANWVAGHTSRFRCIVTHASLWALDQFSGTTDVPAYWLAEFGDPEKQPERYREFSPHLHLDKITTPMLVIHGDKDYRVPIGEGLRLWWDLQRKGVESKFLYFPDENHWVLKPGDAKVWYDTVHAWLAQHVLGEPWQQPDLL